VRPEVVRVLEVWAADASASEPAAGRTPPAVSPTGPSEYDVPPPAAVAPAPSETDEPPALSALPEAPLPEAPLPEAPTAGPVAVDLLPVRRPLPRAPLPVRPDVPCALAAS